MLMDSYFDVSAPPYRLRYNISVLIDVANGPIMKGSHGGWYYSGGLQTFAGITAKGNSYKSSLGQFISKKVLSRYDGVDAIDYDTEETVDMPRVDSLMRNHTKQSIYDFSDQTRYSLVNKAMYNGNVFYDKLKQMSAERSKKMKPLTAPLVYREGKPCIKTIPPLIAFIDSLSQFSTDSVEKIQEKDDIGESGRNTESLRDAMAKSQMINELPHVTVRNNLIVLAIAHLGDKHQLDPMAPPTKQFAYLKQGLKLKRVSENFTFLPTNLWAAVSGTTLNNQTTKASEYPTENDQELPGDTDLNVVSYFDLRSKGGSSGIGIPFIFSQQEGFLEGVTMWHLLKTHKGWGLIPGHNSYACVIYPDVFANRKQVRGLLKTDEKFYRAVELTAESRLLEMFHPEFYYEKSMPMAELYTRIKELGYDWDRLLSETRYHWVWEEQEKKEKKKPLTIVDLYEMAKGNYHPTWYGKKPVTDIKKLETLLDSK